MHDVFETIIVYLI